MYINNEAHIGRWLTMIQSEQWLTLHWRSFSWWGRECCAFAVSSEGGQYFIYDYLQPIAPQMTVTPLELQLYFRDHTRSLDNPYIHTWSDITNCHSDVYIGSTFRICSLISHISITRPVKQLIHDNGQAKREEYVYHIWISTGLSFSILNGYSLSAGKLIPGRRPNDYSVLFQWCIPTEMRCRQY